MSKALQKDVSFFFKVEMVQKNLLFTFFFNTHLPVYSLICMKNIKYENMIINNYRAPHARISTRKWRWTTFQLSVAKLANFNYFPQT